MQISKVNTARLAIETYFFARDATDAIFKSTALGLKTLPMESEGPRQCGCSLKGAYIAISSAKTLFLYQARPCLDGLHQRWVFIVQADRLDVQ